MYRFLTALQRGFHNWIGWKRLGIAASLVIIALAISTLLRMQVRPSRHAKRGRFRPIWAEKAQTPETVTLDPRSDEDANAQQVL